MPTCLIISSLVAASRVGGGVAPFILPPLGVDPVHVPTTLLGRHPGWGPPGGGPVAADMFEDVLKGVEDAGVFARTDAVVAGYFASRAQVEIAARAIARVKASATSPKIIVDPVMGDGATGLYVPEDVADAIAEHLVPLADLITPNVWELARLSGRLLDDVATPSGAFAALKAIGKTGLASSLSTEAGIGVLWTDGTQAHLAETPFRTGPAPKGTGDVLALTFVARLITAHTPERALNLSVGAVAAIIERALARRMDDLPLAASADLLRSPPDVDARPLDV